MHGLSVRFNSLGRDGPGILVPLQLNEYADNGAQCRLPLDELVGARTVMELQTH